MPYDDPDPTDPSVLIGVALPAGDEAVREMAYTFAEEFAAAGFPTARILGMFRNPFYAGAHQACLRLGDAEVEQIVNECVAVFGRMTYVTRDAAPAAPATEEQ